MERGYRAFSSRWSGLLIGNDMSSAQTWDLRAKLSALHLSLDMKDPLSGVRKYISSGIKQRSSRP